MRKVKISFLIIYSILSIGIVITIIYFSSYIKCRISNADTRVDEARKNKQTVILKMFDDLKISYPPYQVFIRIFKIEKELEVWACESENSEFKKIKSYQICALSGKLGPKRKEGDHQVPEGIYKINRFNPCSRFHLSIGLDYPNASDRILADPLHPGGDIFIHGGCGTIGCIPIKNDPIEEVYLICLDSKLKEGIKPVVHIFPCMMNKNECREELKSQAQERNELQTFWQDLEKIYSCFEKENKLPLVDVDKNGRYVIKK